MSKITAYASNSAPADADVVASVDVSDTSMAASGTTKKLALSDLRTYVKTGPASAVSQPSNPASTVSVTLVMMGVGGTCKITPGSSGKVLVTITGELTINTAVAGITATFGCRYGTGTAPTNGAAVSGTRWGAAADYTTQPPVAAVKVPFAFTDLLTLTPATAYWFDIALATSNAADSAAVFFLSFTALEVS
jgi:hypothetical protein